MPTETRKITHEMARKAYNRMHDALYNGLPTPCLSIPPQPDDVDVILCDYIKQQSEAEKAQAPATPAPYWQCPNDESHSITFKGLPLSAKVPYCTICPQRQYAVFKGAPATPATPGFDEATEARWQNAIYELCKKAVGPDNYSIIDGGGSDSGDALDFTLAEIGQAIAFWQDRVAEAAPTTPDRDCDCPCDECGVDAGRHCGKAPCDQPPIPPTRPNCDYTGHPSLDSQQLCRCGTCQLYANVLFNWLAGQGRKPIGESFSREAGTPK